MYRFACLVMMISPMALAVPPPMPPQKTADRETQLRHRYFDLLEKYCTEKIPRPEFLRRLEALIAVDGSCESAQLVRRSVDLMRQMIREDTAAKPPAMNAVDARGQIVRRWIFALRDQPSPGEAAENEVTPQAELTRLGFDAVPYLIEALDDDRWMRETSNHQTGIFPKTIGECCVEILTDITAFNFWSDAPTEAERRRLCKETAREWWNGWETLGVDGMLVKKLRHAEGISYDCRLKMASCLVRDFPDVAFREFPKLAAEATMFRSLYIQVMDQTDDEQAIEYLRSELRCPDLEVRVAAAKSLHAAGRPEGLAALLEEWRCMDEEDDPVGVAELLAVSGSEEAIEELRSSMACKSAAVRCWLLRTMVNEPPDDLTRPTTFERAKVNLLIDALGDETAFVTNIALGDLSVQTCRLCDLAAAVLAFHRCEFPDEFDAIADVADRNRQIHRLKQGR